MSARQSNRRTRRAHVRAGFTIVELVFAIMLMAIGLLALAGLGLATSKMTRGGGIQTIAAARAQARFDSLSGLPCQTLAPSGSITSGAPPVYRGIRERWAVTSAKYSRNLSDTLYVPGRTRPLVYQSVIPCR